MSYVMSYVSSSSELGRVALSFSDRGWRIAKFIRQNLIQNNYRFVKLWQTTHMAAPGSYVSIVNHFGGVIDLDRSDQHFYTEPPHSHRPSKRRVFGGLTLDPTLRQRQRDLTHTERSFFCLHRVVTTHISCILCCCVINDEE